VAAPSSTNFPVTATQLTAGWAMTAETVNMESATAAGPEAAPVWTDSALADS
jgi:hypothetical protein